MNLPSDSRRVEKKGWDFWDCKQSRLAEESLDLVFLTKY